MMSASRSRRTRTASRRVARTRKPARSGASGGKAAPRPRKAGSQRLAPVQVLYRLCKPGWAVTVEKAPNAQGTRFVCPFCPVSHRVPGPVRGFRKMRRAQWVKLRRVEE